MPYVIRNPWLVHKGVRLPGVDELKGIAILLVIYYHLGPVLEWRYKLSAECGVDIFTLLSGFMLSLNARTLTTSVFLKRRLFRIFPAYWIALLFCVLLRFSFFHGPTLTDVTLHFIGIHGIFVRYIVSINDSFWYITFILGMYLFFWGIKPCLNRPSFVFAIGAASAAFVTIICDAHFRDAELLIAPRILSFSIGLIAGEVLSKSKIELAVTWPTALGIACLAAAQWYTGYGFEYPVFALIIIIFSLSIRHRLRDWAAITRLSSALAFIGVYSYEIYLIHQPLIREINLYTLSRLRLPPTFPVKAIGTLVALSLVMGLSMLLHRGCERALGERNTKRA